MNESDVEAAMQAATAFREILGFDAACIALLLAARIALFPSEFRNLIRNWIGG